jgi:hypothetical protein
MNGNINIWNIRTRITPERTLKIIGYQFGAKFKLVFCAKYDRGLDLGFWEILKPLKWTNITSFFLTWLKRCTKICISVNLNKPLKWTNITSFFLTWLKRCTKICISVNLNKILCFRHLFLVKKNIPRYSLLVYIVFRYIFFTRNKDLYKTNMSYYNLCGIGSQHSNISKGKRWWWGVHIKITGMQDSNQGRQK